MSFPDFEQARDYALDRLANELPSRCIYHCIQHTRDDVVPAVNMLAEAMGVSEEEHLLLVTAAYFHDTGFIYQAQGHEEIGVEIAREVLPGMGYSPEQIDVIDGLIMATKMPQNPQGLLQEIMADADMDSLGRRDFFTVAERLRAEIAASGNPQSDAEWYEFEVNFLSNHQYWTEAARQIRGEQKQRNIAQLQDLLQKSLT